MSTTTTPVSNPAAVTSTIVAANTPADVVNAMLRDKDLMNTILAGVGALVSGDKSMLQSKTFWAAIFTPIVGALAARYAAGLDGATVGAITTVLTSAAMIAMRWVTKVPISGVLPATPAVSTAST